MTEPLFGKHDYDIVYGWSAAGLRVSIHGRRGTRRPSVGDIYSIGRSSGVCEDFEVSRIEAESEGWSATGLMVVTGRDRG